MVSERCDTNYLTENWVYVIKVPMLKIVELFLMLRLYMGLPCFKALQEEKSHG